MTKHFVSFKSFFFIIMQDKIFKNHETQKPTKYEEKKN